MNKMTMGLVWHNCQTCPPEEKQNMNLVMTDGECTVQVAWIHGKFFYEDIPLSIEENFWWADLIKTTTGYFENRNKPSLKDAISHRELRLYVEENACPREFGLETEYMEKFCPPGYWQGDCKKCWESKVVVNGGNNT